MSLDLPCLDHAGERYGTRGQIEVLGWDGISRYPKLKNGKDGVRLYTILCHDCKEKDSKLYNDGIYLKALGTLRQGHDPCNCSRYHKKTFQQYLLEIEKACEERNYTFLGTEGKKTGQGSVNLKCNVHNYQWTSQTKNFLNGQGTCPCCANKRKSLSELLEEEIAEKRIKEIGGYSDEYHFWRAEKWGWWYYTCPVCSNDEYVENGLCTGIFKSVDANLFKGCKNCRCGTVYRWSNAQLEYKARKIIDERNLPYTFEGFDNKKLILKCKYHTSWKINFLNLKNGHGCPLCAKCGYKSDKPASVYVLRVMNSEGEGFTGFGITNDIELRMRDHRCSAGKKGYVIYEAFNFETDGYTARDIENKILKNFPLEPQVVKCFKKEATSLSLYEQVVNFVKIHGENNG